MSRMTSSTCGPGRTTRALGCSSPAAQQQQQQTTHQHKKTPKVLTDFTIDSIMGQQHYDADLAPEQQNQQRHNSNPQTSPPKKYRPKNFQCPVCQMAFSNNGQLKNHVRIHTGERPFCCNQPACNKTFTRNEELTRHKLIHTGVRPHACPHCCKSFGRKDHLKKHVRTHERKRLRKRIYVPTRSQKANKSLGVVESLDRTSLEDPLYAPSKANLIKRERRTGGYATLPPACSMTSIATATTLPAPVPPAVLPLPVSSLPPGFRFDQYSPMVPPPPPPVTLAQHFIDPAKTIASALVASGSLPTSPGMSANTTKDALQQLAGDYWHKWYNFLGFCQQQTLASSNKRI